MANIIEVETSFENALAAFFKDYKFVISAYIYGSHIINPETANDIDLLLIISDETDTDRLYIMSDKLTNRWPKIEPTVVLEYEAKNFIHQGFSSFFYFNLKHASRLVTGRDFIACLPPTGIRYTLYGLSEVAQRARNAILDKDDIDIHFLDSKLSTWVLNFSRETLFVLYGIYCYDRNEAFRKLSELNPRLKGLSISSDFSKKVRILDELEKALITSLNLSDENQIG